MKSKITTKEDAWYKIFGSNKFVPERLEYEPIALTLIEGDDLGEIIANAIGGTGIYQFTLNGENYGSTNVFTVTEDGTYTVVVTDSAGCQAEAIIEMEIKGPCIPNYFSPNGDGVTDTWSPGCTEDYPNLTFDIFDRYGRMVATYRVGEYWDGRYNGQELPTGDYSDQTGSEKFDVGFALAQINPDWFKNRSVLSDFQLSIWYGAGLSYLGELKKLNELDQKPTKMTLTKVKDELKELGEKIYYFDKDNSHKNMMSLVDSLEGEGYNVYFREVKYGLADEEYMYEVHAL